MELIRYPLKEEEKNLFALCQKNRIQYVITSHNLSHYPEFKDTEVKRFDGSQYPFGPAFTIYAVK